MAHRRLDELGFADAIHVEIAGEVGGRLPQQLVRARGAWRIDLSRDGEDLAPLLDGLPRGDQRPARIALFPNGVIFTSVTTTRLTTFCQRNVCSSLLFGWPR